jgi:hypothetical protein
MLLGLSKKLIFVSIRLVLHQKCISACGIDERFSTERDPFAQVVKVVYGLHNKKSFARRLSMKNLDITSIWISVGGSTLIVISLWVLYMAVAGTIPDFMI